MSSGQSSGGSAGFGGVTTGASFTGTSPVPPQSTQFFSISLGGSLSGTMM
jgi:hypothetical protein